MNSSRLLKQDEDRGEDMAVEESVIEGRALKTFALT